MIHNPTDTMEIQIEDEAPFIPDKVINAGVVYRNWVEFFSANDDLEWVEPVPYRAVIHYIVNHIATLEYYKTGTWESGTDDLPRFHVYEKLE